MTDRTCVTDGSTAKLVYIALPWDALVSDNQRHGPRGSRIGTTRRWRQSLLAMRLLIERQIKKTAGLPWTGPVTYEAWVTYPDRRRRDLGNLRKAVEDAMEGLVFYDDSQIVAYTWRLDERGEPGARITVRQEEGPRMRSTYRKLDDDLTRLLANYKFGPGELFPVVVYATSADELPVVRASLEHANVRIRHTLEPLQAVSAWVSLELIPKISEWANVSCLELAQQVHVKH